MRRRRAAQYTARRAAHSPVMRFLARAGLAARGVMYVVIGWLAVQIAFGHARRQADQTGALHAIGATAVGGFLLWLLVVGFIGMALWRLSEALYGSPGTPGRTADSRLTALGQAVIYGVIAYGVLRYALGAGSPPSSDTQSADLTAALMRHPGGRILVVVIGLALLGGGGRAPGAWWNGWANSAASPAASSSSQPGYSSSSRQSVLSRSRPRASTRHCVRSQRRRSAPG